MITAVVTTKGRILQNKQVNGADLTFTRVVAGTTVTPVENLKEQTAISNIKQTLSIQSIKLNNDDQTYTILVLLENTNLKTAYNLSQVGFYANDPDDGEILFAIAQIDTPKKIEVPTIEPCYTLEMPFTFKNADGANVIVEFDPNNLMSRAGVEKMINEKIEPLEIQRSNAYTYPNSKAGGLRLMEMVGNTEQKTLSGKNKFDKSTATDGYGIGNTGKPYVDSAYSYSDYIEVEPNTSYAMTNVMWCSFYDENKTYLSNGSSSTTNISPATAEYVRLSFQTSKKDSVQFEEGEATDYEPYCGGAPSPNPGYPQAIENVGDCVKISQGGYDNAGGPFYNAKYIRNNEHVLCKEGDVIKIYAEDSAQADLIYFNGDSFHSFVSDTNANEHKFTVPNGANKFKFNIKGVNSITPETVGRISLTINNKYVLPIKIHGENYIKPQYETTTKNGITITDNGDGTYTLNGKCTENVNFDILTTVKNKLIPNVEYKVVGCPKGGSKDTYYLYDYYNYKFYDYGDGGTFVFDGKTTSYVTIKVLKGTNVENVVFKPMITINLEATYDDFEPYTEHVEHILLDEPLRVGDRLVRMDGVAYENRKRATVVFDGSDDEDWMLSRAGLVYLTLSGFKKESNLLCDRYIGHDAYGNRPNTCITSKAGEGMSIFVFDSVNAIDLATWKAQLQANPITVEYVLAEETFTPLDAESQKAINRLMTFDGVTHLEVDSKIPPSSIDVLFGTSQVGAYTLEALSNIELLNIKFDNMVNGNEVEY